MPISRTSFGAIRHALRHHSCVLAASGLAFSVAAAALTWRLYVGVPKSVFRRVVGLFAFTALVSVVTAVFVREWSLSDALAGAAAAYAAVLLATYGRPERMLETWRIDGPEPSDEQRRVTRRYQWRFIGLVIMGAVVWTVAGSL